MKMTGNHGYLHCSGELTSMTRLGAGPESVVWSHVLRTDLPKFLAQPTIHSPKNTSGTSGPPSTLAPSNSRSCTRGNSPASAARPHVWNSGDIGGMVLG